ncbi:MAG TPA: YncE family protein [Opitutaceae bacterium]|nr:YncE family protein [Opitutaceae bacterium]
MKKLLLLAGLLVVSSRCPGAALVLEQAIPLPGIEGRIDHLSLDAARGRLFVAALGHNSVEVVDLKKGAVAQSITGLAEPQGVLYAPESNRLFVANGDDGTLRVFDGATLARIKTFSLSADADNLRYDAWTGRVYVGCRRGALDIVDAGADRILGDVSLDAHPEAFALETGGPRIFVNVPGAHEIAVVDRTAQKTIAHWPIGLAAANFPLALDETDHRLFVGCRLPARLLVFDTTTGREIAKCDLHGDCDDLFYDVSRRQIYASCGAGFIDVFAQADAGHYALCESVATAPKARTSFFDGDRIYLAVPKRGDQPAEIRCYRLRP